jgi:phosphonate transport system substrate-binding protein
MTTALLLRATLMALFALLAAPLSAQTLVFAVNEGVTYRVSDEEIRTRYSAISTDLSKLLNQTVRVEPVASYPALRKGLADKTYDLALVHPMHISVGAIKHSGYKLVATTKGFEKYAASFLVRADSRMKSLADLKGVRLGAPDEDSITGWLVRATVRDALGRADAVTYTYTRYQDAVPFFVENTLTQAGATAAAAVVKKWEASGGKVLARSKSVPIKNLLAGPNMSAADVEKVRDYFVTLDSTEAGRKKLEPLKVTGYVAYDAAAFMALGTWLGL